MSKRTFVTITQPGGYKSASPLPSSEELAEFYAQTYFQTSAAATYQASYPPEEIKQRRLRASLAIEAISQAIASPLQGRSFLEVGCGEGFLLKAAADAGMDVTGLDFSRHALEQFHPNLLDRLETGDALASVERLSRQNTKFSVIVLQNVLEHVREPEALLRQLHSTMQPGAVVVAQVPNDFSRLQAKGTELGHIGREYWFCPPQHLHYFNTENFPPLVKDLGFSVIDQYGDFPIEFFLFHPGSNYTWTTEAGHPAHMARVHLELLMAEAGLPQYLDYCRALSRCGMGRNLTVLLRSAETKAA